MIDEDNTIDIEKLIRKPRLNNDKITEIVQKNNLNGFLSPLQSAKKPGSILLNYDVEEVKKMITDCQSELV